MLVRAGDNIDVSLDAAPYADMFLSYSLLSQQAYQDRVYDNMRPDFTNLKYCYSGGAASCTDLMPRARSILNQWRIIYASNKKEEFPCAPGRSPCTEPLAGLGVQIWVRRGSFCSEAVVAFRGTDFQSSEDWISNLRWLLRLLPVYDQYEQVQDHTPRFVRAIENERCFVRGKTRIVAVGHSLGGGLAQQAAWMSKGIRHVYAFDPSIVTGSSDKHVRQVIDHNSRGLKIERIYEHGEVIAYLRYLQRHLIPPTLCNPEIRAIRFAALKGNAVEQHSLGAMNTVLLHWSSTTKPSAKKRRLPAKASAQCSTPEAPRT